MDNSYLKRFACSVLVLLFSCTCQVQAQSPVDNGEFDNQIGSTPDWWWGQGGCTLVRTTEQARNGNYGAAVSNRTAYWQGAAQELNGDLTVGKDYHFQCWVRTKDVPSGVLRIEIVQTDDRGQRFIPIAKTLANDSQWTLLEGGFHLLANGNLDQIAFVIGGDYTDDRLFDFYVDAVTITENDWRAAADQRIEQFRKRDLVLNFEDADGNAISDVDVEIQQIGHRFAFGSTLNDGFLNYPVYADFYRQNFEWGTIEYFAQWIQTELVQGVEDYTLSDATIDFAEENGIQLRGHALTWPDTRFMPQWLIGQSSQTHLNEINERIDNVVSRYAGRLVHWDVNNEMLNFTYFQDILGANIRSDMFKRAKQNDPNVKLFTNEFGLTQSGYKTDRYRQLVQSLQNSGADVGGIGLQSHFDSNVSPKALELTLAKLTDLGPEIWFTEYDASNPDPVERAKLLETFYRYAFSVPEARGIIMWGFWAGNHWRGADSAIVDLDWTINAAGQKYFELLDEWTTNISTSVNSGNSAFSFRGTHGNFLVKATHNGVESYHVVSLVPDNAGNAAQVALTLPDVPTAPATVFVYGSPEDDTATYDFKYPERISINGVTSSLDLPMSNFKVGFVGMTGVDSLRVVTDAQPELVVAFDNRVLSLGKDIEIQFFDVESIEIESSSPGDRLVLNDSVGDDTVVSTVLQTEIDFGGHQITAVGFKSIGCRSKRGGVDTAIVEDSAGNDNVRTNGLDSLDIRNGQLLRQFSEFEQLEMTSTAGRDVVFGIIADEELAIDVQADQAEFDSANNSIVLTDFYFTKLVSNAVSPQVVSLDLSVSDSADQVVLAQDIITVRETSNLRFSFRGFSEVSSTLGDNDNMILRDSRLDDLFTVSSTGFSFINPKQNFTGQGSGNILAVSRNGGDDVANVGATSFNLDLIGNWQTP